MANFPSDKALCRPALLWDIPALVALEDEGAEAFIKAFGPAPIETPEVGNSKHPLLLAAAVVANERAGNRDAAEPLYGRIEGTPWRTLLSTCLRAWAPPGDIGAIQAAAEQLTGFDDNEFCARIMAKLVGIAVDRNEFELARGLLERAIAQAPKRSRLDVALHFEHYNLLGRFPPAEMLGDLRRLPQDPLVDYDWIDAGGLGGAREQLAEMLTDRARSPWSTQFRVGQTPVDRVVAAEQQATWAGALWLRNPIRKQVGSQILLGGAATPAQLGYGLLMWLLGGGLQRRSIADFLEPRLGTGEIDSVVGYLLAGSDPTGSRTHAACEICVALWDCLRDETALEALSRLSPDEDRFPLRRDIVQLWTTLGNRLLPGWEQLFLELTPSARAEIAAGLEPEAIAQMEQTTVLSIGDVVGEMPVGQGNPWLVLAAGAKRLGTEPPKMDTAAMPTDQLVELAHHFRDLVPEADLERLASRLVDDIERTVAEAHEGRFGIGAQPEALLGQLIPLMGAGGLQFVPLLVRVSEDPYLAGESRLAALTSLGIVQGEFGLDDQTANEIRNVGLDVRPMALQSVGRELLEAATLLALHRQLSNDDEAALFSLARADDPRARQLAVNTAGLAYRTGEYPSLGHLLLGALFDPEPLVIEQGLQELATGVPGQLRLSVNRRLHGLYGSYPRRVRRAAVTLACELARNQSTSDLSELVRQAREDKSWLVRRAADAEAMAAG